MFSNPSAYLLTGSDETIEVGITTLVLNNTEAIMSVTVLAHRS